MKTDFQQEENLDDLIICRKCATLHKKIILKENTKAICSTCKSVLYRKHTDLLNKSLALSLSTLIFFIVANVFPIVTIDLGGTLNDISLSSVFITMIDQQFYFAGLLSAFVIFLLPLSLSLIFLTLLIFMKIKIYEKAVKKMLVILSTLLPWNMVEIFLISLLVAMVKLIGYAEIHFGISFWALVLFVLVNMYMTKNISMLALWGLKKNIYGK
ncbi:MAG: paraquat-inducible protein A [Epsilonproteobacteria bacterium]|nr:paraquat-inducible protein A [Campylobacterota bacterium]